MWAPRGTPADVIAKLNDAVGKALSDSAVRRVLTELGLDIPSDEQRRPESIRAFHQAETAKWWPIIRAAGIKAE